MTRDFSQIVAEAIAAAPLPTSPDRLDEVTRRKLDREAARRGVSATEALSAIRAEEAAKAADRAEADAIAKASREW